MTPSVPGVNARSHAVPRRTMGGHPTHSPAPCADEPSRIARMGHFDDFGGRALDSSIASSDMSEKLLVTEPQIGSDERDAVDGVLRDPSLSPGSEVETFEAEFGTYLGAGTCVAVSSGSSALHLGLLAAGVGVGDEVVVPSFTSLATVNAVAAAGATPVFAEIDPDTFCLDPHAAEAAIGPRTAAVLPVHLFGQPADMTA